MIHIEVKGENTQLEINANGKSLYYELSTLFQTLEHNVETLVILNLVIQESCKRLREDK